jgi:voltage-gated potassium channel
VAETTGASTMTARLALPSKAQSPLRLLGVRILIALSCLVLTTMLVYFGRSGYVDNNEDGISLLDAAYYATVSLSTTGYGDITPSSDSARVVSTVILTPLRFLFLIVLVGTALETLTKRTREEWRAEKWRRKVREHTLVIGFGVKGRAAAQAVMDSGSPAERIVVITADVESAMEAKRLGLAAVVGDARREEILMDAGIDRASRVIITTNADDTSVLITLASRRLAPQAKIVSSARESASAQILRDSGADGVIVTAEAAGRLLSMQLLAPHAGDLMEDLLDSSRGLEVAERPITRDELGLGPNDLEDRGEIVLAVIREGQMIRFDESNIRVFQRDDAVVVVRQRPNWAGPAPYGA